MFILVVLSVWISKQSSRDAEKTCLLALITLNLVQVRKQTGPNDKIKKKKPKKPTMV